jgi:general secretion pathway protein J
LALQAGLGQWAADLDAIALQANTPSLAWDGRVLRVLRRGSVSPGDGLRVVGWSQRQVDGITYWLRWQSPSLRTRAELDAAWAQAARWGQNPSNEDPLREVRISPLSQWQIFYFRNNAWTNPQSSASATDANALPEGVRLVLTLPAGQAISGVLTRDWARTEGSTPP